MSQSESRGSGRRSTQEAVDSMVILQNCFITVSRLNIGCFSDPDKNIFSRAGIFPTYESRKTILSVTSCIMCNMARTVNKVHIRVFHEYSTFNWVSFTHGIFTSALSIEKLHGILCNPIVAFYQLHYVWWAQLYYREQATYAKYVWELEAFTGYLLHHLESNFVLYAAALPIFLGHFFAGLPASPAVKCSRSMLVFFLDQLRKCVT